MFVCVCLFMTQRKNQVRVRLLSCLLRAFGKQIPLQKVQESLSFLEDSFLHNSLVLMPDKGFVDVAKSLKNLVVDE